jgi:predicted ATPase
MYFQYIELCIFEDADMNTFASDSRPYAWISGITFSDGSRIKLDQHDVTIIVGPNNVGKSATLRGLTSKLENKSKSNPVIQSISIERKGSHQDVESWLEKTTRIDDRFIGGGGFEIFDRVISRDHVQFCWEGKDELRGLAPFFCTILNGEERITAANAPENIAITREGLKHPIHFLQWNDSAEQQISNCFKKAFGTGITVHRNAGRIVPLLVGNPPQLSAGEDRHSIKYIRELEKLPQIETQGDGMRSFLGVLLFATVGSGSIVMIDEPEAFLHPPQARYLGSFLSTSRQVSGQLFIATHSGDVLRGILDVENDRVRVIRLRREGDKNVAQQLDNAQIARIWSDPLLRYSNILDGLFHERVILCEGDSDCRFYSAIADTLYGLKSQSDKKPDVMFASCGGKTRLPLVMIALRNLGVPISIVADFDVLRDENNLREICEASGGQWSNIKSDWKEVKRSIEDMKPELSVEEIKRDIDRAFSSVTDKILPEQTKKQIQTILRRSSPWSKAKSVGPSYIPSGSPAQALKRLTDALERLNIFVVPEGEMEGFVRTEGAHGPAWVASVLKKDLHRDPELQIAKDFVARVIQ